MPEAMKVGNLTFIPYKGIEHDIDMNEEWYCPYCRVKLTRNDQRVTLYCPTHYEDCEYTHHNKSARERYQVVWHEGYQYPLTYRQVVESKQQDLIKRRKELNRALRENKKDMDKVKVELANLDETN